MARHDQHVKIEDRVKAGDYDEFIPLDYIILSHLHDEGELAFGLYPVGETAKNLMTKFTPEQQGALTTNMLASRLRTLALWKLALPVTIGTRKTVWQRTKTGKELLTQWETKNNGNSHS